MSKRNLTRLIGALIALVFCLAAAPSLAASELDVAKAAGHVGERADGTVGVVSSNAPESAKALVESVNAARKKSYAALAAKNGLDPSVVASQAGAKLMERASPGQYIDDGSGWKKKQ
ncbi:MAG: YdbL family protein [Myxococcales bacterium]|nr:YdbL family protein [Myxococcales bacterium]